MATPEVLEEVGIGTTSPRATVERGTETIKTVVSKAGESGIHDLVITDNRMPGGMSGAEMAHVMKLRSPSTPIIMSTSVPPENVACVDLVLRRPAHLLELKDAIEQIQRARQSPEP